MKLTYYLYRMYMHAHSSGQRGCYHHYNLYYTLHLVVLGYEQEAARAGLRRCTDQFPQGHVKCRKSNILIGGQKRSATSATCKKCPSPPPVPPTKQCHVTCGKVISGGGRLEVPQCHIYCILKINTLHIRVP
jgi:hypothetical protein